MDKAFLELLEQKDFAYITVKEICERAGVNRSTFYLHYETVADLLSESMEYMNRRLLTYFRTDSANFIMRIRNCSLEELYLVTPEYLTPYLCYIKEHKRLFRTAIENPTVLQLEDIYKRMVYHVFTPILERYQIPEKDRNYFISGD